MLKLGQRNHVLLLGLLPFMAWRWFRGDVGRPNAVDVCVLLCALWAGLSLVVNHGLGASAGLTGQ